jgi:hypothetical protein
MYWIDENIIDDIFDNITFFHEHRIMSFQSLSRVAAVSLSLIVVGCSSGGAMQNGDASSSSSSFSSSASVANILIQVLSPQPNSMVTSPLTVMGQARGTWYFEASFPVHLLDGNGNELAVIPAQAQSDWMTVEMVPFLAQLTFPAPTTSTGTLVLKKDNPSGDPIHDDQVTIPVRFY